MTLPGGSSAWAIGGTLTNSYDVLDRLLAQSTTLGTVSYQYDALGRRTRLDVPGVPPTTYGYDANSRLTQILRGSEAVGIQYDAAGRRTRLTLPNEVSTEHQYDLASRLTALIYRNAAGMLGDLSYQYDPAGNRTRVGGSFARTLLPAAVASATYDQANRQLAFGDTQMAFDQNGNLTTLADATQTTTFTWDARDRLIGVEQPGTLASFAYGFGRRLAKTVNGATTQFLYDDLDIAQQITPEGATSYLRSLAIDETLDLTTADGAFLFIADALGSTVAVTDPAGGVVTEYTYEPFGATTATTPGVPNPFQFTGRENDGLAGLYYYRARYYHPDLQRFISEDPIKLVGGVNLFVYVGNAPARFVDPQGLDKQDTWQSGDRQLLNVILVAVAAQAGQTCVGVARVLRGNPALVGRQGAFPGVRVRAGTAAIVPAQFGLANRQLRPHISNISGTVAGGTVSFSAVTDVIGGRSPIPGMNVRDALQQLNPNTFIIELVSINRDLGVVDVELSVPVGVSCPTGTRPK